MKNPFFAALVLLICLTLEVQAQENRNWTFRGGIDKKTSWKIGGRYQIDQTQIGLAFWPGIGKKSRPSNSASFQFDFLYHFADHSNLNSRKPWFFRNAVTYQIFSNPSYKTFIFYYYLHLGREFNITDRIGIYGDVGLNIRLRENYRKLNPDAWLPDDIPTPFSVGYEVGVFFKLK